MSKKITEQLNPLLSDHMVLYQKLRNYHWNVRGSKFFQLHDQFEKLYLEAALAVDEIAERIGALGGHPTSTLKGFLDQARLKEDANRPNASDMVSALAADYDQLTGHLRKTARAAEEAKDTATMNLLDGLADGHEKTAWMLRAFLDD